MYFAARQLLQKKLWKWNSLNSPPFPPCHERFCSVIVYICVILKKQLLGGIKGLQKNASSPRWPMDPLAEDERGRPNSSQAALPQHPMLCWKRSFLLVYFACTDKLRHSYSLTGPWGCYPRPSVQVQKMNRFTDRSISDAIAIGGCSSSIGPSSVSLLYHR